MSTDETSYFGIFGSSKEKSLKDMDFDEVMDYLSDRQEVIVRIRQKIEHMDTKDFVKNYPDIVEKLVGDPNSTTSVLAQNLVISKLSREFFRNLAKQVTGNLIKSQAKATEMVLTRGLGRFAELAGVSKDSLRKAKQIQKAYERLQDLESELEKNN